MSEREREDRGVKVFVVMGIWDYEGHDKPIGVYTTRELAEKAIALTDPKNSFHSYNGVEIYEYDVDSTEDQS